MKNKISLFDLINITFMLILCALIVYPIWYILILSFNDGNDAMLGGIYFWPRIFTLDNYSLVFSDLVIIHAFAISILRTFISTIATLFFTAMTAYAWSKKELIGRNIFLNMGILTMFFSGGLIPHFLLIRSLGLYNNFFVFVIPALFNFFNFIIFQTFFRELPLSLEESAKIDGAGYFVIFTKLILPLSKPVLATIMLFHGVYSWNDFFMGSVYIKDSALEPIATYLYRVIAGVTGANMADAEASSVVAEVSARGITSRSVQLATMVVGIVPIILIYPFLQKYFVKGFLIGSVKE